MGSCHTLPPSKRVASSLPQVALPRPRASPTSRPVSPAHAGGGYSPPTWIFRCSRWSGRTGAPGGPWLRTVRGDQPARSCADARSPPGGPRPSGSTERDVSWPSHGVTTRSPGARPRVQLGPCGSWNGARILGSPHHRRGRGSSVGLAPFPSHERLGRWNRGHGSVGLTDLRSEAGNRQSQSDSAHARAYVD